MNKEEVTHSFTGLNTYEQCPRIYEHKYVLKIKEPPSEHQGWGEIVHKNMEDRVRGTVVDPLPKAMEKFDYILIGANAAKQAGLLVMAEQKIAISREGAPVDFWSKYAWVRGKIDLAILARSTAELADYKTGKWKSDKDQMRMTAWMAFSLWPLLEKVTTRYHWLKGGDQNKEVHTRDSAQHYGADFTKRIIRIENARASGHYQPTPNGLCKAHCNVLTCEFNGNAP